MVSFEDSFCHMPDSFICPAHPSSILLFPCSGYFSPEYTPAPALGLSTRHLSAVKNLSHTTIPRPSCSPFIPCTPDNDLSQSPLLLLRLFPANARPQIHSRRPPTRLYRTKRQSPSTRMYFPRLVCRWSDFVRWVLGQSGQGLGCRCVENYMHFICDIASLLALPGLYQPASRLIRTGPFAVKFCSVSCLMKRVYDAWYTRVEIYRRTLTSSPMA